MNSDTLGYLLLAVAGVGGGGMYIWRRFRRHSPASHTSLVSDPTGTTTSARAELPASAPVTPARYRRLRTVTVHCEHLDHRPGDIPAATITQAFLNRDVAALRRTGWGGNAHTNVCYYHNPNKIVDLVELHVVCATPNCGERDTITIGRVTSDFARLGNRGWVNIDGESGALCPYCSGRRRRPRW